MASVSLYGKKNLGEIAVVICAGKRGKMSALCVSVPARKIGGKAKQEDNSAEREKKTKNPGWKIFCIACNVTDGIQLGGNRFLGRRFPLAREDMSFGVTIWRGKMHTIYIILLQSLNRVRSGVFTQQGPR